MSLIVGDKCRPKLFGGRKLSLQLGQEREVKFYWQKDYAEYFKVCLYKGLYYIQNTEQLDWVEVVRNNGTVQMYPRIENIYSSVFYISMYYGDATKVLTFSIFLLYSMPDPVLNPTFPLITSNFTDISDTWLPANSKFTFSDNYQDVNYDNKYGVIMFIELEQEARKIEHSNTNQKYLL